MSSAALDVMTAKSIKLANRTSMMIERVDIGFSNPFQLGNEASDV
jgi:hypothetical protein